MLAPETVLQARYRIVRQLGQGGMGAVYEAVDQRLDTTVALKETLFVEEKLRKQFEREARLLARLHHPALPRVSDHFAEGDGEFLVMQYIAGDDLAEMMAQRQSLFPPEQVMLWGDQLLDALDYLHTQDPQIIHRDIKPQNLKLTGRGQIVLLDFGLAKGQVGGLSRVTTSASIFGYTPNYAPLEQVQGLGTDPRSDIYALAATLYHLLTGIKPADALTRAAAIVNGQPDPLQLANEVNSGVDPSVAAVLQKAMAQNREQRFATAEEMRRALRGTGETIPIAGRSEAATILFPSSSAPTALSGQPTARMTATATPTPSPTGETTVVHSPVASKRRALPWAIAAAVFVFAGAGFGAFYAYQHRSGSSAIVSPVTPAAQPPTQPSAQPSASIDGSSATEPAKANKEKEKTAPAKTPAKKEEVAKKNEKPAKEKPAEDKNTKDSAGDTSKDKTGKTHTDEKPAESEDTQTPPDRSGRRRGMMPGGVQTRTFPDGRKVMITPDGTRIVTFPNGTTRVFRPGEKMNRRP
jgi:serine/threonine protein kinase